MWLLDDDGYSHICARYSLSRQFAMIWLLAVREKQPDPRPAGSRNNAVTQSIHV